MNEAEGYPPAHVCPFVNILPAWLEELVLFQTMSAYVDVERKFDGMLNLAHD